MLLKNFAQISNSALGRIELLVSAQISYYFSGETNLKNFKLENFTKNLMELIGPILTMLQPAYVKKLWKSIGDNLSKNYVLMNFAMGTQYEDEEISDFRKKVAADLQFLKDLLSLNLNPKDVEELTKIVEWFYMCLKELMDDVIGFIAKIAVKLKGEFGDKCIVSIIYHHKDTLTHLRCDFSIEDKIALKEILLRENAKLKQLSKKDVALEFYKCTMRELNVHKFIRLIRSKLLLRNEMRKRQSSRQVRESFLVIEQNERLVVTLNSTRKLKNKPLG
jgi:hypothetical protein